MKKKNTKKKKICVQHVITELQKTATLGTAHIIHTVQNRETTLHVAQIVNTEQLQHYKPQKHAFFQIYMYVYIYIYIYIYICKYPA
jgi:hypothetical protein